VSQEPNEQRDDESSDGPLTVGDDRLPEDLRPGDDNPLAQPADDDVPDDLLVQDAERGGSGGGSGDATSPGDGGASDTSSSTASSETESEDRPDD
jgi:hypothetical protein